MFETTLSREARIAGAAALLADIRRGRRDKPDGLPPELRPADQAEAEAVQLATYAALGWSIAGWKVGRANAHVFAAPLPDAAIAPVSDKVLKLPLHSGMELEVALRLTRAIPGPELATLTADALPGLAEMVMLFELVETRYAPAAKPSDLEKIADIVSNGSCVVGPSVGPQGGGWSWADVEGAAMRLTVDGIEVAKHAGPHRAIPIAPLIEAWRDRCLAIGHEPKAGEVITLGSLTGLLPVPAAGGVLHGEFAGRGTLTITVGPLGA
jgi:2-keto-4-pentenoate hydratase